VVAARKRTKLEESEYRNPRDFENMDDKDILQQVLKDIQQSQTAQQPYFDKFVTYYQMYNSFIPENQRRPNGANLFIPYVFNIVETITPRLIKTMFSSKPFLVYKPVTVDDIAKAKKMTRLVDFQLHQRMRAIPVFVDIVKSALLYGTAISKQTWRLSEKKFVKRVDKMIQDPNTGEQIMAKVPVLMNGVKYDAPFIQNVPLEDFFIHPYAANIYDSPYAAHRYWLPLHELWKGEKANIYKNIKEVSVTMNGFDAYGIDARLSSIGMNSRPQRGEVEIIEYWTDDWKVMVANRAVIIQSMEHPFWHREKPFSKWIDVPIPNEFYGKGEIEICRDMQYELNTTRNQRIDNVTMVLNRMFKILRTANIDTDQLISRPNGFIEVDNMDDIRELEIDDVTQSGYQEESVIKRDMDDATGVYDYGRGAPADRRETATTASILAQAGSERFELKVNLMEMGGLADCGMQLAELNRQFIDHDIEIRITDDYGNEIPDTITPEDVDVDLDMVAVGSAVEPSVNKEIRQNQLIQLLANTVNNPYVNQVELLKEIFEAFEFKDVEGLINQQPPPPAQQEVPVEEQAGGVPVGY
jgi:hypothetical protein